ncbi:hypothetical protein NSS76_19385 [Bacillus sp. FSL R5-0654]|uniref:hypothetical protein n=1 Tax=Bacillus TaxID=1386 RepID=UPI0030001D85
MDSEDVLKYIGVFMLSVIVLSIGVYVHYLYFFFDIWLAPTIFWVIFFSALIAYSAVND